MHPLKFGRQTLFSPVVRHVTTYMRQQVTLQSWDKGIKLMSKQRKSEFYENDLIKCNNI